MKRGSLLERIVSSAAVCAGLATAVTLSGVAALTTAMPGCGSRTRSTYFTSYPQAIIGPLRVHYDLSMTQQQRNLATQAVQSHWQAVSQNYSQAFAALYGSVGNAPQREVFVYDVAFLNGPYKIAQKGYAKGNEMHLVRSHCSVLEDATHQIVHSYLNGDVWDQQPDAAYWQAVFTLQDGIVQALTQQRHANGQCN